MRLSGRTLLLLVAAIIAAFTAISVRNRLSQAPVAQTAPANRIIVAKRDLAPGNFVQGAQDLDWGAAPAGIGADAPEYLHEGAVRLNDFNGAVVRRDLHAGGAIAPSALMKSGEGGFMSAVLDPGKRAVSIAVTATSGNAGFVSPGDHIDLIVTHRIKTTASGGNADDTVVSETFIHNVRVVAVDQMLDNPENKAILAKTITVEVAPREAEQVAVAEEMGKISIALRSLMSAEAPKVEITKTDEKPLTPEARAITELYGADSKPAVVEENNYTRDSDISQMLGHKGSAATRVHVIRGDQIENLQF